MYVQNVLPLLSLVLTPVLAIADFFSSFRNRLFLVSTSLYSQVFDHTIKVGHRQIYALEQVTGRSGTTDKKDDNVFGLCINDP